METIENNITIAEFMKCPKANFVSGAVNYNFNEGWFEAHELSYDVSMAWLVPVIKEIGRRWIAEDLESVENDDLETHYSNIYMTLPNLEAEEIYPHVVGFIKTFTNLPRKDDEMVCDDMHGTPLQVGDKVAIVDIDDIEYDTEATLKKGDILEVNRLNDHESNHMNFKNKNGQLYGLFGHRVVKTN